MVVYMDPLEVPKDHPYDGFGDLIHNWSTYGPPWKGLKNLNRFSLQGYMDPLGVSRLEIREAIVRDARHPGHAGSLSWIQ